MPEKEEARAEAKAEEKQPPAEKACAMACAAAVLWPEPMAAAVACSRAAGRRDHHAQ